MLTTFVCAHNFKINRNISVPKRVLLLPPLSSCSACSSFVIIVIHVLLANIQIAGNQWLPTRAVNRLPYNPCAHLHPLHITTPLFLFSIPGLSLSGSVYGFFRLSLIENYTLCFQLKLSWYAQSVINLDSPCCRGRLSLLVFLGYRLAISLCIFMVMAQ